MVLPLLTVLAAVTGCATPPKDPAALAEYRTNDDPLEPTNRVFFAINNGVDTVILRPLALGYRYVLPPFVRNPIHRVLDNLSSPVRFANDVLETKPRRAGDTFMRFLINSTVGVGGMYDVAAGWGYPPHEADGGITFALWGLPQGPYLFLPVLGPSNLRDVSGMGMDVALDPITWPPNGGGFNAFRLTRLAVTGLDARANADGEIENIKHTALDPYATFRSLYTQHRDSVIDQARQDDRATVPNWFSH